MVRPGLEIERQQPEEPEPTLEDEFQDLHLNLPVLEVLAHAPIYNVILDKYMESLELGKNGSAFVQGEIPVKMEDPGLFTLPCRLGDLCGHWLSPLQLGRVVRAALKENSHRFTFDESLHVSLPRPIAVPEQKEKRLLAKGSLSRPGGEKS
ncbi:hypothetical protein Tco_1207019 [Tanacetum coccineum]